MALRCILQRQLPNGNTGAKDTSTSSSNESDMDILDENAAALDSSGEQKFAMIPSSVTVANLLEFVLRQLNVRDSASECSAKVVMPGWKTLSLAEICSSPASTTVHSLLANVSNIAVLLIRLPAAKSPPLSPVEARCLLRSLLPRHSAEAALQANWLRLSGCPLDEAEMSHCVALIRSNSPDLSLSETALTGLAEWRLRLQQLAVGCRPKSLLSAKDGNAGNNKDFDGSEIHDGSTDEGSGFAVDFSSGAKSDFGSCDADEDCSSVRREIRSRMVSLHRLSQLHQIYLTVQTEAARPPPPSRSFKAPGSRHLPAARLRLFIDPHTEIPQLERHFAVNRHPDAADCRRIADQLNRMPFRRHERRQMQAKNVRLWFKNRRARSRRFEEEQQQQQPAIPSTAPVLLPAPTPKLQMQLPAFAAPVAAAP